MEGWMQALEYIVWLTQLGLSMLLPPLLCVGAAWWLTSRLGLPQWIWLPAILLGLFSGAQSFLSFAKMLQRRADKAKAEQKTVSFNQHK